MPAVIPIMLGVSALGGALANRPKTSTSQATQNYSNTSSSTSTPNLTSQQQSIYDILVKQAKDRLNGMTPGLQGYESTGLSNINSVSNAVQQNIANRMAAQGLSGCSIAASAGTQQEIARGGQSATFQNSLPLLQNQLQLQNIGAASGIFGLPGVGQNVTGTSSGTGTSTGTSTQPGNMAGGALSSVGGMLGFLAGQGMLPGQGGGGGSTNGGMAGTAATPATNYGSSPSGPMAVGAPSPTPMAMPPWLMQALWGQTPGTQGGHV